MPQNVEARAGFLTLGRIWSLWGLWASGPEWLSWNKTQFLGWLCKVWGLLASALGSLARAGPEHQWPWLHERGNMLLRTAVKYCWGWEFGVCSAPAFNWVGVNEWKLPEGGFLFCNLPMAPPGLTLGAWHGCAMIPEFLRGACLCPLAQGGAGTPCLCQLGLAVPGTVALTPSKCQSGDLHRFILIRGNVQLLATKGGAQMFEGRKMKG